MYEQRHFRSVIDDSPATADGTLHLSQKIDELKQKAPHLRHTHLKRRLAAAKAAANEKAIKSIQRLMSREAKRKR